MENDEISEDEMQYALEMNKKIEMKKVLANRPNVGSQKVDSQLFGYQIEKKNLYILGADKVGKKMTQVEAMKLTQQVLYCFK